MAGVSAVEYAMKATADALQAPDWALTFELCDIVNMDQRQAREVMKLLKKRLGCKNPATQFIVLDVLETLSKNCGENVLIQIIECSILHEMVKIVNKKCYSDVKKKIVILIGTWKDSFGGQGKYPEFYAAFKEIQSTGTEKLLQSQEGDTLVPSQIQDSAFSEEKTSKNAFQASVQSDISHQRDIRKARGIAHMLMEMLNALNPRDSEGAKQEVVADLVDKCHLYKNHLSFLCRNTRLEELLNECIILNNELQHVLKWYDDIVNGKPTKAVQLTTVPPLVILNNSDYESEDDSFQLVRRNSKHPVEPSKKYSLSRFKQVNYNSIHPTSSKKSGAVAGRDYKPGDRTDKTPSVDNDKRLSGDLPVSSAARQSYFQKHPDNSVTVDHSESLQRKNPLPPPTSQSTISALPSGNSRKQLFTNKQLPSIGENSSSYDKLVRNSYDHTSLQDVPTYSSKQTLNHSDGPDASIISCDARSAKGPDQRTSREQEQCLKINTSNDSEPNWKARDQSVLGKTTSSLQQPLSVSGVQISSGTSSVSLIPMNEHHEKQPLNEQQKRRLGTSISSRFTGSLGKNNNQSSHRECKSSSPSELSQSHSDSEDPRPQTSESETSSKSRHRLKHILDFGKKGKKSSESKSGTGSHTT